MVKWGWADQKCLAASDLGQPSVHGDWGFYKPHCLVINANLVLPRRKKISIKGSELATTWIKYVCSSQCELFANHPRIMNVSGGPSRSLAEGIRDPQDTPRHRFTLPQGFPGSGGIKGQFFLIIKGQLVASGVECSICLTEERVTDYSRLGRSIPYLIENPRGTLGGS